MQVQRRVLTNYEILVVDNASSTSCVLQKEVVETDQAGPTVTYRFIDSTGNQIEIPEYLVDEILQVLNLSNTEEVWTNISAVQTCLPIFELYVQELTECVT